MRLPIHQWGHLEKMFVSDGIPISKLLADELDAVPGLDNLETCIPWLEKVYTRWQSEGGAANFPLIVAAATPRGATIFHSTGWAEADGCCDQATAGRVILAAIEAPVSTKNTDVVAAGLSLILGPDGRARQQRDADAISTLGSVPLVVALLASTGEEVENLVTTIAVASRVLN
jgi:hypothetical protein